MLCAWIGTFSPQLEAQTTTRVTLGTDAQQANGTTDAHVISADGRFIAVQSFASNFVVADTNSAIDIFVRELSSGQNTRVSVSTGGAQGNGDSTRPAISADGRFVAFDSDASNLVAGDTNATTDVFVRDRLLGHTVRVSVDSLGVQGNSNSAAPSISADGRFIAFYSNASNLVADDTGGIGDLFVHDRQSRVTTRVSVSSSGEGGNQAAYPPSISADGRFVAFRSSASNMVAGDTNSLVDVFVHDRVTWQTVRLATTGVSLTSELWRPSISADGRHVAFESFASNLVTGDTNGTSDVFVHDRLSGQIERVSLDSSGTQGNGASGGAAISADGRYVAFQSIGANLVDADTNFNGDAFLRDRLNGQTTRVSVATGGAQANSSSGVPTISADARLVSFSSFASNLVVDDTNGIADVFVHERVAVAPSIQAFGQDAGSVAESCLIGTTRRAFTVSWQASGVAHCRPHPAPGANSDPFADDCSAAPVRGSNWWPGSGELPFFVNGHRISVCPAVSGSLDLRLRCFAESGAFVDATLEVPVTPVSCGAVTAGISAFGAPMKGWLETQVFTAEASSPEGDPALTVDVLGQGLYGSASAEVIDGIVELTYALGSDVRLTEVVDSVEIAIGDSAGAAPQSVPIEVPGRIVFESDFE